MDLPVKEILDKIMTREQGFVSSEKLSHIAHNIFQNNLEELTEEGRISSLSEKQKYQREMDNYIMLLQASSRSIGVVHLSDTGPPNPPSEAQEENQFRNLEIDQEGIQESIKIYRNNKYGMFDEYDVNDYVISSANWNTFAAEKLFKGITSNFHDIFYDKLKSQRYSQFYGLASSKLSKFLGFFESFIASTFSQNSRITFKSLRIMEKALDSLGNKDFENAGLLAERVENAKAFISDYRASYLSRKKPIRILWTTIGDLLFKITGVNPSETDLSKIIYKAPDNYKNLFAEKNQRTDISTILDLEYKLSGLQELELRGKQIDNSKMLKFKSQATAAIRYHLQEYGYVASNAWNEFHLIRSIAFAIADADPRNVMPSIRSLFGTGTQNIKDGFPFDIITVKDLESEVIPLTSSISKDSAIKELEYYKDFYDLHNPKNGYHRHWKRLVPVLRYGLSLQSMGLDIWSGEEIPSDFFTSEAGRYWFLHHIDFDKRGIHLHRLALVSRKSHNDLSHPKRMGRLRHDWRVDKATLEAAKISLENGRPPDHWNDKYKAEYYERMSYFKTYGHEAWFKEYYGDFYDHYTSLSPKGKKWHNFYFSSNQGFRAVAIFLTTHLL